MPPTPELKSPPAASATLSAHAKATVRIGHGAARVRFADQLAPPSRERCAQPPSTGAIASTVPLLAPDGTIPENQAEEMWQADTAHLTAWNREFKYILVACDVFTRKTRAEAMKNLSQEEVLRAEFGAAFKKLTELGFTVFPPPHS